MAPRRLLGYHFLQHRGQALRYVRAYVADRLRLSDLMPDQFLGDAAVLERTVAGKEKIEGDAEAVYVTTDIDIVAIDGLFGGEVVGGAEDGVAVVFLSYRLFFVVEKARKAEVEDFDDAGAIHDQVGRLDVAVDEARLVGVLEAERAWCM